MTNNLEDIVTLVMRAYTDTHGDEYDITPIFELEVRKALMQKYCSNKPSHTYSITPGTLTGAWSTWNAHTISDATSSHNILLNG